jgi:flagellar assembly factor FliW
LKQDDALLPLLFNFALEYAISKVQANQEELKLNGTHNLLTYAYVTILGESKHTVNKNTTAVLVTSKKTGLGVYAEKTKYTRMFMCHDQNAGQNHIKRGNKSFERVE